MYGVFIEYLEQLPDKERYKLTDLIYDDNCHLARCASKEIRASRNEITKYFDKIRKSINKFHFGNHVDKWCMENCNPYNIKELNGVNSVVCEQLFKKVNSHTNCKSMNESRYFIFWLYNLDLHNLDIEGLASYMPDPRSEYRWSKITIHPAILDEKEKMEINILDQITQKIEEISIQADAPKFVCPLCKAGYSSEGYLSHHMKKKHEHTKSSFECTECEKPLTSKRNLDNHVVIVHRTCKQCKPNKVFMTTFELTAHASEHTTCKICGINMQSQYKLGRHIKHLFNKLTIILKVTLIKYQVIIGCYIFF